MFIGGFQWLSENRNEKGTVSKFKRVRTALIGLVLVGFSLSAYSLLQKPSVDFIVGGKGFTEQYIIAGLLTAELEEAGFRIDQKLPPTEWWMFI